MLIVLFQLNDVTGVKNDGTLTIKPSSLIFIPTKTSSDTNKRIKRKEKKNQKKGKTEGT